MSHKVKYKASLVCEKTGVEYKIKGTMRSEFYIRNDDNAIENYFIRKLLKRYPFVHLGRITNSSMQTTKEIAIQREEYMEL